MCEVRVQCKNKEQRLALPLWHALAGRKRTQSGFLDPSKSEGAPKTIQKIQYRDFLAPLGGQMVNKLGFGRRLEKTWNVEMET